MIQNVNVSPINYQYYIIQIESNISIFSMIKGVKLPLADLYNYAVI